MFAIMTVTGIDHVGIIAAVSTACAELNINIHNVKMTEVGEREKLVIRIQSQAIFDAMNII